MMEGEPLPAQPIENQFIKGILENDFQVLEKIYVEHLPTVVAMVKRNSGSMEDARDVFQEAIVVVFRKAALPDFELTTSFGGYLYSICRYIWLRQLKKKHRLEVTLEPGEVYIADGDMEALLLETEKRQLFQQKLAELGQECRKVLQLFFAGTPLKEIARQMNYTEDYIKKKNLKCKEKLVVSVRSDPRYQELKG